MKVKEIKVTQIGNSRGIRLPATLLRKYSIGPSVLMEEREDGLFLRPVNHPAEKLSWSETAEQMILSQENWAEWDAVDSDGLEDIPWRT